MQSVAKLGRCLSMMVAVLVVPCARVQASPPFELVGSALGSGGLNARASGNDAASAYFNPARLARKVQALRAGRQPV